MELWPSQLQDYLNEDAFTLQPGDVTIQSDNSTGPKKRRRRVTAPIDVLQCTITIDRDDYQLFRDFYYTTLAGGILSFGFDDPITGVASEYKIEPGWSIVPMGGRNFRVSMNWEKQL
jgi:hypothetical protein